MVSWQHKGGRPMRQFEAGYTLLELIIVVFSAIILVALLIFLFI